jgi:hypothetical protein
MPGETITLRDLARRLYAEAKRAENGGNGAPDTHAPAREQATVTQIDRKTAGNGKAKTGNGKTAKARPAAPPPGPSDDPDGPGPLTGQAWAEDFASRAGAFATADDFDALTIELGDHARELGLADGARLKGILDQRLAYIREHVPGGQGALA